jgi:hypothetical protein
VAYQATAGAGAYAEDLEALQDERLVDTVLGEGTKSGYDFAIIGAEGSGSMAVFGVYAVPDVTTGVGQTGTRVFATTHEGVMHGDTDLSDAPATLEDIDDLPVLPN